MDLRIDSSRGLIGSLSNIACSVSLFMETFSLSPAWFDTTSFIIDDLLTVTFCESISALGSNISSKFFFYLAGVPSPLACDGMYCAISALVPVYIFFSLLLSKQLAYVVQFQFSYDHPTSMGPYVQFAVLDFPLT